MFSRTLQKLTKMSPVEGVEGRGEGCLMSHVCLNCNSALKTEHEPEVNR